MIILSYFLIFLKGDYMNCWKKFLIALFGVCMCQQNAWAVVDFTPDKNKTTIRYTSFMDYPPFGVYTIRELGYGQRRDEYSSIFVNLIDDFFKDSSMRSEFVGNTNYSDLVRQVRAGDVDVIFGIYYGTKIYDGLDYVMPALIDNPVTIIMLPDRVGEVKKLDDLQKLKGAKFNDDRFSDYVARETQKFNLQTESDPTEMFKKLYTREIDYILASYYLGVIKASKLGLRGKLSFSKQAIWNMPLFVGVSKASKYHDSLMRSLIVYIEKKENRDKFAKDLQDMVRKYEQESMRTVPPIFTE